MSDERSAPGLLGKRRPHRGEMPAAHRERGLDTPEKHLRPPVPAAEETLEAGTQHERAAVDPQQFRSVAFFELAQREVEDVTAITGDGDDEFVPRLEVAQPGERKTQPFAARAVDDETRSAVTGRTREVGETVKQRPQALVVHRFEKVTQGVNVEGGKRKLAVGGGKDERRPVTLGAQEAGDLEPVRRGHAHVEKGGKGTAAENLLERVPSVLRFDETGIGVCGKQKIAQAAA